MQLLSLTALSGTTPDSGDQEGLGVGPKGGLQDPLRPVRQLQHADLCLRRQRTTGRVKLHPHPNQSVLTLPRRDVDIIEYTLSHCYFYFDNEALKVVSIMGYHTCIVPVLDNFD